MPYDTKAAALRARFEAIIKKVEDAEAQAVVARRCFQAASLLLEEESKVAALEQTATTVRQRVSSSSSPAAASQLVPTASLTYEDTVIVRLHLQATAVLNVHQLVNIVLIILRGLNQCFEHVNSIIRCYSPFLNFFKIWDDLLLEEIHMDSTGPLATPTMLYTNTASPAAKPPSSTPSRPPNGRNGGTGGNRNKYNNKNRNSGNGGDNNSQTTAPTSSDGRTNAPWPTYSHPW
jgi:hypothetical protein